MPENRPAPKGFRFDQPTRLRLARMAARLDTSEADVIRWALAALDGLLRDGLDEQTLRNGDGKRVIHLPGSPQRTLMLMENDKGGFAPWEPFPQAAQWTEANDENDA